MSGRIIKVQGMSCGHCKASVEKALNAVSGVTDARVDLAEGTVAVTFNQGTAVAELEAAIEDAGYEVVLP